MSANDASWDTGIIDQVLSEFIDSQAQWLSPLGSDAGRILEHARISVAGGKRLRAAFCWWGYLAIADPIRKSLVAIRFCLEEQLGFDPTTSDRTFRIYMSDVGQMVFLPKLIERLARTAPRVNIETVQVPAGRMRDIALESGEVDLAMGYFEDFDGAFRQQMLFEERYVGMVRRGHPTIADKLEMRTFLETPQLVYQPRGGGHGAQEQAVDQAFAAASVPRRVAVRAAHAMGVTYMLATTDLLVVAPSRLAAACRELADVSILTLPVEIPRFQVKQHWHERFHQDPGNAWLRGVVAELFQEQRARLRVAV